MESVQEELALKNEIFWDNVRDLGKVIFDFVLGLVWLDVPGVEFASEDEVGVSQLKALHKRLVVVPVLLHHILEIVCRDAQKLLTNTFSENLYIDTGPNITDPQGEIVKK